MSAEDQPTETATSTTTNQQSVSDESDDEIPQGLMEKIIFTYKYMTAILWRIAEIHWSKIISFVVILVSLQQVVHQTLFDLTLRYNADVVYFKINQVLFSSTWA